MDERELIERATAHARENGWDVGAFHVDGVEVRSGRARVSFRGDEPAPGNHFSVWLDAESGEVIQLVPGR